MIKGGWTNVFTNFHATITSTLLALLFRFDNQLSKTSVEDSTYILGLFGWLEIYDCRVVFKETKDLGKVSKRSRGRQGDLPDF